MKRFWKCCMHMVKKVVDCAKALLRLLNRVLEAVLFEKEDDPTSVEIAHGTSGGGV